MNEDFLKRIEGNGGMGKMDKYRVKALHDEYTKEHGIDDASPIESGVVHCNITSNYLALQRKKFKGLYGKAMTFASTDESRKQLNGVCVTHTRDGMEVAATDGRRLFMQKVGADDMDDEYVLGVLEEEKDGRGRTCIGMKVRRRSEIDWDRQDNSRVQTILQPLRIGEKVCKTFGIASQGDLNAFRDRLQDSDELASVMRMFDMDTEIAGMSNRLCLYAEGTIWQEVEGVYPNYHQVIPDYSKSMKFGHFERLAPYLNGRKKLNGLIGCENVVMFKTTADSGDYKKFNGNYLLDAIHCLSGDITCQVEGNFSPVVLTDENGALAMSMPMREDEDGANGTCFCLEDLDKLPEWGAKSSVVKVAASRGSATKMSAEKGSVSRMSEPTRAKTEVIEATEAVETTTETAKEEKATQKEDTKQEEQKQERTINGLALTEDGWKVLAETKKNFKYYGDVFTDMSRLGFINELWKQHKMSVKTYPKKKGDGVWHITCETLFEEEAFKYAMHLLNGGQMIESI